MGTLGQGFGDGCGGLLQGTLTTGSLSLANNFQAFLMQQPSYGMAVPVVVQSIPSFLERLWQEIAAWHGDPLGLQARTA